MDEFKFEVKSKVSRERVGHLLSCAFEGGSNYWYRIEETHKPDRFEYYSCKKNPGEEKQEVFPHIDYPLNPGGHLIVSDFYGADGDEEQMVRKTLDLAALSLGLQRMEEMYLHHFVNFMKGDEDAETGDVFLQCCLFGEIVYS